MPTRDRLLAAVVAVLWGVNFLAIHVGLQHFPPLFLAALRFAVIALPTVLLVPRPQVRLRWLLGYGLGFGTLQFLFLFVAMDVGMPTGLASLVLQASAPFTVVLGAVAAAGAAHPTPGRRDRAGGARAGRDRRRPRADRGAAAGAADAGRCPGLGAGQPVQPRWRAAEPAAPDAVDVGGAAGAAAARVVGRRGTGRGVGRAARRVHPAGCRGCSPSPTSPGWRRCWARGSGRR